MALAEVAAMRVLHCPLRLACVDLITFSSGGVRRPDQHVVAGRRATRNNKRDPAVGYRALAVVPSRKLNILDSGLDRCADGLEHEVIRLLE